MLKQLLITYLCAWFLVPPQVWMHVAHAQEPVRAPKAGATKVPAKSDRTVLREALHVATWQLRDIVKATIPGASRFWLAESHALFDPIAHCGAYYKDVPTADFKPVFELVAAAQIAFSQFFEKRQDDFGKQTSETTYNQPKSDMVVSSQTGRACQPIAAILNQFHDDSGKAPEKIQMQADWLQANANQELLSPYFVGLSRKTPSSPYTDIEARNWIGWMGGIRKFANLVARYHEINETFGGRRPEMPELVVSAGVGNYFRKVLGDALSDSITTNMETARKAEIQASQILSSSFAKENAARFVKCTEKRKSCGEGLQQDFKASASAYCFCDGKEDSGRLMDEEIILTLQTRDKQEPTRTSHGKYLDAMRRLGIKALFSELATANFFLPVEDRAKLPEACVNAGDIQEYVEFFNRTNTLQSKQLEVEKFANAVEHLEKDYRNGTAVAPIPSAASATELYATAHRLMSTTVLSYAAGLMTQYADKPEKVQSIQKEQTEALSRMGSQPLYQRLSEAVLEVGDSYSDILAYKLRLWAALVQEDLAKLEGSITSPHKRSVIENMIQTVILESLMDTVESYLASLFFDAETFNIQELILVWHQSGKPQWRDALESGKFKAEIASNAKDLTATLYSYEEMYQTLSEDSKADELVASQVQRFAPTMIDASLADIKGARAASEIPTPTGEGWQSPVFRLNPYEQLDYQHLKKGLQHMSRGYQHKLVELLQADPRYRDDVWLRRYFNQTIYHPDGSSEQVSLGSAKALANAIVEKFIETSDADPVKDFDWSAKSRAQLLAPLKTWLVGSPKEAKEAYDKQRTELSKLLFIRYILPVISNREGIEPAVWSRHFEETIAQIDRRDIIVPFRSERKKRAQSILDAYEANEEKKKDFAQQVGKVQNVILARQDNESFLVKEQATVPSPKGDRAQHFIDYVQKYKDDSKKESASFWLIPLQKSSEPILLEFYKGRLKAQSETALSAMFTFFAPGKMEYPGEEALKELRDKDSKADDAYIGTRNPRNQFFLAIWGQVDSFGTDAKALRPEVDTLLVDIFKALHSEANAKKDRATLLGIAHGMLLKFVTEKKLDIAWAQRLQRTGETLTAAIDSRDPKKLSEVFVLWAQVVGLEYGTLHAGFAGTTASLQSKSGGKEFEDTILPAILLPTFEEFRSAVLNYVITLTTPQAAHIYPDQPLHNPYEQVTRLQRELHDWEFQADDGKGMEGEKLAEFIRRRSHLKYMIERARHQIAANENLKRSLRAYLADSSPLVQSVLQRLDSGSYQEIWNAYYEDQFLDTFESVDGKKMALSPRQVLKDLNEVAKTGAGVMDVSFYTAKLHLKEIKAYCEAGQAEIGVSAFNNNYRLAIARMAWEIASHPTAFIQYKNQENLENVAVKKISVTVDRLMRLRALNPARKATGLDGWFTQLLYSAVTPEKWMDLPSSSEWCKAIEAKTAQLQDKLKTHSETLEEKKVFATVLPVDLAREYGELVQLTSDIWHGDGSTFGPIALKSDSDQIEKAVWFTSGPYLHFYKEDSEKEVETKDEPEKTPSKKVEKVVDVVSATRALVAFARLDAKPILYSNIVGEVGPSLSAQRFFTSDTPEARVAAVQSMSTADRVALFDTVKNYLLTTIRSNRPTDQFSPKPKAVPEASEKKSSEEGSESQPSEPSSTTPMDGSDEVPPVKESMASGPGNTENEDEVAEEAAETGPIDATAEIQASDEIQVSEEPVVAEPAAPAAGTEKTNDAVVPAALPTVDTELVALKEKVPADLYAVAEKDRRSRDTLVRAMAIAPIAARVTKGEFKDYLSLSNAVRDWPVDQYASNTEISQELLTEAKKTAQARAIFDLAMRMPRLKDLALSGGIKTMSDLRVQYQRSLYLFSAHQRPPVEYRTWRDDLIKLLDLWLEMKNRDAAWGIQSTSLFAELSLEIFERFFRYLPYGLSNRKIVALSSGSPSIGFFKNLEAFRGYSVPEQAQIIDKLRILFLTEVARVREAVLSEQRELIAGRALLEEKKVKTEEETKLELFPFAEGSPVAFKKPEGEEVASAFAKLLLFYASYFGDSAIPETSFAVRTIEDWRRHCERRESDVALVYTTFFNQYKFSWAPLGQKLNEKERFAAWVTSLLKNAGVQKAFSAKSEEEKPSWAPKRLWNLNGTLQAFVDSPLFENVTGLLGQFDENAKATPEPHTYPFFLALLNWKTNPKRYGVKPGILESPARKPYAERLAQNGQALLTGQPNPNAFEAQRRDGLRPEPSPLMQYHIAGLMNELVDLMGINLKDFNGWEAVLDRTADEVHTIVAASKRFGLVGTKSSRFANTSVPSITTENGNWGPDFETRFFPIIPAQRNSFLPADTFQEYAAMVDRPGTYLRYQINTGDQDKRPLYKQMAAVQTRMVGVAELLGASPNHRASYKEHKGNWKNYTFGGNPVIPENIKNLVVQRAEAAGVSGVDAKEVERLILIRERYVDLLEKMSQTIAKYPGEATKYSQVKGNSALLGAGDFATASGKLVKEWAQTTGSFLTAGWITSPEGATELDQMLQSYKSTIGWTGTLIDCGTGPKERWIANAIWQAGVMTQWKVEQGLDESKIQRQRDLLTIIDKSFSEKVQGIEYRKAVKVVTGNILPRLEKLCAADRVKFTRTDEEFESVKELVKESNLLYYEKLGLFINEFLPEGNLNKTYLSLMALKAEKEKWREFVDGVGTAVHVFLTISLVSMFVGRNPMGARFTSTAIGRAVHVGAEIIVGMYFAWELYDQFNEDYWGGQGRVDFLMGNRDTQIEGYLPLVRDETGFLIDVAQDDLLARQQSAMRWTWRIWMGLIVFQQLSYAQRVLRGGMRWVLQKTAPQTFSRFQMYSRAKALGLDARALQAMAPKEAADRIRVAFLEKIEVAMGKSATRYGDVFELSPGAAATVQRDIRSQLNSLCKELHLNPESLTPLPLYGSAAKVQKLTKAREEAQSTLDELWALDQQLTRSRILDKEDVLFIFAGKDSFYLPGLGHPVHRVMPRGLMFTGFPPALYSMGPGSRTLGRLYKAAQGKTDLSNLVTFNYLAAWREKAHGELIRIAEYFRNDIAQLRSQRLTEAKNQRVEYGQQLRNGEVTAEEHSKLVEALGVKEAVRTDVDEVLRAMLDTQHPLHSHFRYTGTSQQLRGAVTNESGSTLTATNVNLGSTAGRPAHISEDLAVYAAEFRSICQNGAISAADADLIAAIGRRDYYWLGKEFSRPSRVSTQSTAEIDEALQKEGVGSQGSRGRSTSVANEPTPTNGVDDWLKTLKGTPKSGVPSPHMTKKAQEIRGTLVDGELQGLDFEACWSYAVRSEQEASRQYILSLARTRSSSEMLQYSYGEKLRNAEFVGEVGLMQQRAYRIAIAYTRDMEIAIETARTLNAKNAQAYFNVFHRLRLRHLERVLGEAPSVAQSKAMFGMNPDKAKWGVEDLRIGRETAIERGIDPAIAGRGESVLSKATSSPYFVEDYARLTEIPVEYFEIKGVVDALRGMRGAKYAGRALGYGDVSRLNTLFSGRPVGSVADAERLLSVSANSSSAEQVRSAASRLRTELTPKANRSDRKTLSELGQSIPENEQMYLDAIKRVDEAERLLLKPPGSGPTAGAPRGPNPGSGPGTIPVTPTKPGPSSPTKGETPTPTGPQAPSAPSSGATPAPTTPQPPNAKTADNASLLDHPVVQKYVGPTGSGKLYDRRVGEEMGRLGETGARVRVIEQQGTLVEEQAEYLSGSEASLMRLLHSARAIRDAQAAGALENTTEAFDRVNRVFLNNYVRTPNRLRFWMGVEGADHVMSAYLTAFDVTHTKHDLKNIFFILDQNNGPYPVLKDQTERLERGKLTAAEQMRLEQAWQAFNTLVCARTMYLDPDDGELVSGIGFEGMALTGEDGVPLEVLLQEEVLADSNLLAHFLREGRSNGKRRASVLQALFADKPPQDLAVLKRDAVITDAQVWRFGLEINRRLAGYKHLATQGEKMDYFVGRMMRARQRLVDAGFRVPEMEEGAKVESERAPTILLPENGFKLPPDDLQPGLGQ